MDAERHSANCLLSLSVVACGGANEHGPHGWWKYLERIGRCHLIGVGVTGVGFKNSSPCQGQSSLHSAFRAGCEISVCLLTHGHASDHDGETWSESPMKCFPLQAALVTVFGHSNKKVTKTRGLKTDYAVLWTGMWLGWWRTWLPGMKPWAGSLAEQKTRYSVCAHYNPHT